MGGVPPVLPVTLPASELLPPPSPLPGLPAPEAPEPEPEAPAPELPEPEAPVPEDPDAVPVVPAAPLSPSPPASRLAVVPLPPGPEFAGGPLLCELEQSENTNRLSNIGVGFSERIIVHLGYLLCM
jgi:hypothetical protein